MINQYAAGKNVYKGGLPNAQSGTLNPDGYIKRESNRRSGLAAIAMARKTPNPNAGPPVGGPAKKTLNLNGLFVNPAGKIGRLE